MVYCAQLELSLRQLLIQRLGTISNGSYKVSSRVAMKSFALSAAESDEVAA